MQYKNQHVGCKRSQNEDDNVNKQFENGIVAQSRASSELVALLLKDLISHLSQPRTFEQHLQAQSQKITRRPSLYFSTHI